MAPPPVNIFRIPGISLSPTGAPGVRPGASSQMRWVATPVTPWSQQSVYLGNTTPSLAFPASHTAHAGNVSLPPNYLLTYDGNRRSEIARLVMQLLHSMQIAHESTGRARANAYNDAVRALSAINQLVSKAGEVAANLDGEILRAAELHRRLAAQMIVDKYSLDARQVAADLFALYPRTAAAEHLALLMDALERGVDDEVPAFMDFTSIAMHRSGSLMVWRRDEPPLYAYADPLASETYEVPLMMAAGGSGTDIRVGPPSVYDGTQVSGVADEEMGAIRIRIPDADFIDRTTASPAPIAAAGELVGHRERLAAIAAEGAALTFEARLFFTKVLFDEAGRMEAEFQRALKAVMDLEGSDAPGAQEAAKEGAKALVVDFGSWVLAYRNAWHLLLDGMISRKLADNILSQLEDDGSLDAAREGLHRAALAESIMQELRSVALQIPNNIGLALPVITSRIARNRSLAGSETLQIDLARGTHRRLTVDGRNHLTLDAPHEFAEFAAKLIEYVTAGAVRIRRPLHELVVDAAMANHRDPPTGSFFSGVGWPPDRDALAFRVLRHITGWEIEIETSINSEAGGEQVSWHLGFETSSPWRGAAGQDSSAAVCEAPSPHPAATAQPIAATLSTEALSAMNVEAVRAYVSSLPASSRLDVALMLVGEADAMRTRVAHDVHAAIARGSSGLPDHDAYDAAVTAWSAWRRWYDAVTEGLRAAAGREPTDLLIGDLLSSIAQEVTGGDVLISIQRLLATGDRFDHVREWLARAATNPLRQVECRGSVVCQTTWARKEIARTLLENLSMSGGQQRPVTMRHDGDWFIIETYEAIDQSHAIGSLYRGMQWPYDPQNPELKIILNLLGWEMVVKRTGDRVTYRINLGNTRIE